MSLFGAATTGVSPQTGSYLSKEERIAMFKRASGRRGYAGRSSGGGGDGGGGDAEARRDPVQATSAIVAVNSMTSTMQKLQVSNQESVQQVQVQVEKNRQNIETLFTNLTEEKQAELQEEKTQTRQDRRRIELGLRAGAERLLEGLKGAVSNAANALGKVAQATTAPVKGLLDKLFELLSLFGAAWAIDNLPAILDAIKDFTEDLPSVSEALSNAVNFMLSTRGLFGILDRLFQPVKNFISRLLKKVVDIFTWIATKATQIFRKIFKTIKDFIGGLLNGLRRRLTKFLKELPNPFKKKPKVDPTDAARNADNVKDGVKGADNVKDGVKGADAAADAVPPRRRGLFDGIGQAIKDQVSRLPKPFQDAIGNIGDAGKRGITFVTDKFQAGKNFLGDIGKKIKDMIPEGQVAKTPKKEQTKFLSKLLSPLTNLFPSKIIKDMLGLLAKIPGIGIAIDYLINTQFDGMEWMEGLIRAIPSGVAGGAGALGGAKVGAIAGGVLGTIVPVIGNVVGAAIGGIIGGFLGGALMGAFGDDIGRNVYKAATGKEPTANDVMFGETANKATKFLGDTFGFDALDYQKPDPNVGKDVVVDLENGFSVSLVDKKDNTDSEEISPDHPTGDGSTIVDIPPAEEPPSGAPTIQSMSSDIPGSTPEGLQVSESAKNTQDQPQHTTIELPPDVIDISEEEEEQPYQMDYTDAQEVPDFPTTDDSMDLYREFAQYVFEAA